MLAVRQSGKKTDRQTRRQGDKQAERQIQSSQRPTISVFVCRLGAAARGRPTHCQCNIDVRVNIDPPLCLCLSPSVLLTVCFSGCLYSSPSSLSQLSLLYITQRPMSRCEAGSRNSGPKINCNAQILSPIVVRCIASDPTGSRPSRSGAHAQWRTRVSTYLLQLAVSR